MPFGRDTVVVPSNVVLDWDPFPPWEGEIWGSEPVFRLRNFSTKYINGDTCLHICKLPLVIIEAL